MRECRRGGGGKGGGEFWNRRRGDIVVEEGRKGKGKERGEGGGAYLATEQEGGRSQRRTFSFPHGDGRSGRGEGKKHRWLTSTRDWVARLLLFSSMSAFQPRWKQRLPPPLPPSLPLSGLSLGLTPACGLRRSRGEVYNF